MNSRTIRVIAICLFRRNERILVFEAFDKVKKDYYYRPLGGAVEFGETTRQALEREIKEELGQEIADVSLLGVLENVFVCDGAPGHEIVFVYDGRFANEAVYQRNDLTMTEDGATNEKVLWRRLDSFDANHRLVPEKLVELLRSKILL
jgi:ADP-ribose pyrophosphatase YjhB (NUDIX family)